MSARESRKSGAGQRRSDSTPSVVGSTLSDISSRLSGRRSLPKGGIREQGTLTVAEGALPDSTIIGKSRDGSTGKRVLRMIAIVSASLIAILVIGLLVVTVLSRTTAFSIGSVLATDTEHMSAEDIVRLASVEEGTTLLNVDVGAIEKNLQRNPWVGSVSVSRAFPDALSISVAERVPAALVSLASGGVTWILSEDGHWIEPVSIQSDGSKSSTDSALARANEMGVILIANVAADASPEAGKAVDDSGVDAALSFHGQFSDKLSSQIVQYSAPDSNDVTCILANGVEVSLGSASNVEAKEKVILKLLEEYEGQITYINVRVPSRPTYRRVDSPYVNQGTGANGPSAYDVDEDEEKEGEDTESDDSSAEASESTTSDDQTDGQSDDQSDDSQDESTSQTDATSGTDEYGNVVDYGYDESYATDAADYSSYDYGYSDDYSADYGQDYSDYTSDYGNSDYGDYSGGY